MTRKKIKIIANSSENFLKAEKALDCLNPEFVNLFDTCDTSWIGHSILKLSCQHYFNENGCIVPAKADVFKITEEENVINVKVNVGDIMLHLEYGVQNQHKQILFHTMNIGDIVKVYQALSATE